MVVNNCAQGSLAPFQPSDMRPWNAFRARHLLRRMGFGASPEQVRSALELEPGALVDTLIDQAMDMALPPEPEWAYWSVEDYEEEEALQMAGMQARDWMMRWFRDMAAKGFREKLSLFWHNHFVTRLDDYFCPSYLYQYHRLLQEYCLGNFKSFTHAMGTTPAMLVFLNGVQNTRFEPNENYARELYELFTLGQDNGYTQQDIEETARALTGWVDRRLICGPIEYAEFFHDTGEKTIFGRTGNWGYDEVHDILFAERAEEISVFICDKIYRHFVHPQTEDAIVGELAQTFRDNNFELAPVFRQLFKSEHFFDPYIPGTQVRSPLDSFVGFLRDGGFSTESDELTLAFIFVAGQQGQRIFDPVDVAGWPGNRAWLNTNTITLRWQSMELYVYWLVENYPERLREVAKLVSNDSNDPAIVAKALADHFISQGLSSPEAYQAATDAFKSEVPQNYFDDGAWNLDWDIAPFQIGLLLQFLIQQPDFQLS
mgnify:CR=1 FL=1